MASKGRIHLQQHKHLPPPGPGLLQRPDQFGPGPGIRPPPEIFSYDLERKLDLQHVEIKKLAIENQRIADSHHFLRRELAAAQHELQTVQAHTEAAKIDGEHKLRGFIEKIKKMEPELKSSENVKSELQQAHSEAQNLIAVRQDLVAKVQSMSQDLQKAIGDVQQIPVLMSELDSLRQEYQQLRATYDYERKLRLEHYESLQLMEKSYVTMVQELEKLRAELANSAGSGYGNMSAQKENNTSSQVQAMQGCQTIPYSGNPTGTIPSHANTGNNPSPSSNANPNSTPNPTQGSSPYGPTHANMALYNTAQAPQPFYGTTQVQQSVYGSVQYLYGHPQVQANPYGLAQVQIQQVPPQQYGSMPYGSVQPPSHVQVQGHGYVPPQNHVPVQGHGSAQSPLNQVPVQGQNNPARK